MFNSHSCHQGGIQSEGCPIEKIYIIKQKSLLGLYFDPPVTLIIYPLRFLWRIMDRKILASRIPSKIRFMIKDIFSYQHRISDKD